jgi:hypothetical protein
MKAGNILSSAWKLYFILIVSLFLLPNICSSQTTVDWYQIYKGPSNTGISSEQIAVDNSGNVFVTGTAVSGFLSSKTNYLDIVTAKFNSSGVLQWQKSFFNSGEHQDIARALSIDKYSNVYVVGEFSDTTDNTYSFVTLKYNSSGDLLWARKKTNAYKHSYYRQGIIVDSSLNVHVICTDENLSYLIKYDSNGDSLWTFSTNDHIIESLADYQNNILITGGNKIKKISPDGILIWDKTLPRSLYASNLTKDLNGNYYLCGERSDTLCFYKISVSGEILWSKYFKKYQITPYYYFENTQRILFTKDGNILIGFETPKAFLSELSLMKFSTAGDLLWDRKYSCADTSEQFLTELKEDSRGFIYVSGYSRKSLIPISQFGDYFVILKYDSNGKLIRSTRNQGLPTYSGIPKCFTIDSYDKLYLVCDDYLSQNIFYSNIILAKFSQPYDTLFVPIPTEYNLSQNYPNPFNVKTNIKFEIPINANVKLTIFNVLGKRIETLVNGYLSANWYEISWDASPYSSGVYFYRLETEGFTSTKKMILVK